MEKKMLYVVLLVQCLILISLGQPKRMVGPSIAIRPPYNQRSNPVDEKLKALQDRLSEIDRSWKSKVQALEKSLNEHKQEAKQQSSQLQNQLEESKKLNLETRQKNKDLQQRLEKLEKLMSENKLAFDLSLAKAEKQMNDMKKQETQKFQTLENANKETRAELKENFGKLKQQITQKTKEWLQKFEKAEKETADSKKDAEFALMKHELEQGKRMSELNRQMTQRAAKIQSRGYRKELDDIGLKIQKLSQTISLKKDEKIEYRLTNVQRQLKETKFEQLQIQIKKLESLVNSHLRQQKQKDSYIGPSAFKPEDAKMPDSSAQASQQTQSVIVEASAGASLSQDIEVPEKDQKRSPKA